MASMPAVKLLDLKKEADPTLAMAWRKKDLPAMLKYLSQARCVWHFDFGPVSLYVKMC